VRYGADTGPQRFRPPLPPTPWAGIVDADEQGPASPQAGSTEPASEDCLFLNVWTPGCDVAAQRPVMVYIHGGAYASGSCADPQCDGTRLAARGDVVVVTINHRLNALGYLYLARLPGGAAFADSGNCGQLDLVLALQWVRDNVAAFGGDPRRVMVFGQSGGGAKIATLMAMPAASGLFHRAATMSGQQVTASGPLHATARARGFLDALQLSPERCHELAGLPLERLLTGLDAVDPIIGKGRLYFGPVLDERSLQRHPFYPDAPALSARIPMIIGNTRDETRSLIGRSDPTVFNLDWKGLAERLSGEMRVDIEPQHVVNEYRKLYPDASPSDVFFAATTAARSWRGALIELEARARQGAPTYAYQLDFAAPVDGGKWGAFHTLDIPLVFGNLDRAGSLTGTATDAQRVSAAMSAAFVALAHDGVPRVPGGPHWSTYDLQRRATMVFDDPPRLVSDPRGAERRLFDKVPFIQQGT
jgi:para-nitrobenzyl esterase